MNCQFVAVLLVVSLCLLGCHDFEKKPNVKVDEYVKIQTDSLERQVLVMLEAIRVSDTDEIKERFKAARYYFKKIEWMVEYSFGEVNINLNGPAIDKAEEYDDKVIEATGFQVMEELIFPAIQDDNYEQLLTETKILNGIIGRLKFLLKDNLLSDENIFEAIRNEVYRIMILGISGFDSPVALRSLQEAISSLQGIIEILEYYDYQSFNENEIGNKVAHAQKYLSDNPDFDSFNRAVFITEYLNPLSESILGFQQKLQINSSAPRSVIDLNAKTIFDEHAIKREFFNRRKMKSGGQSEFLGKFLFFDPILSGNLNRSCASCHNPRKAFTDGLVKSQAFDGGKVISRNAPTLINSAYQQAQFWDLRVSTLEDQINDVVSNPDEMHGHITTATEQLRKSPEYVSLFADVFGDPNPITDRNLLQAMAAYIRSLSSFNAPFDRYMRGDKAAMTNDQLAGFNLFMGKAKCGTCHFMPLFNGTIPHRYIESESEVIGVPAKADSINASIDPDLGKYLTYKWELNKFAFKTPTVRNAALTAPYMHNGVYRTLEEVLDFYNRGGGTGIGIDLPNQTLPPDNLQLTQLEQRQIISFIHALTDTVGLTSIPDRLPLFEDEMLNKRKIGGVY